MRVYLTIAIAAVAIVTILLLTARFWLGDYLSTAEFRQTVFVELLSFVVTSAVVGALSAAVLDYLNERRIRPMRAFAANRLDQSVHASLSGLRDVLAEGYDDCRQMLADVERIATTGGRMNVRVRKFGRIVESGYAAFCKNRLLAIRLIDRFAASFPVEQQEALARIEAVLESLPEGLTVLDYAFGEADSFSYSSPGPREARTKPYRDLAADLGSLLERILGEPKSAKFIEDNVEMFADSAQLAVASVHHMYAMRDDAGVAGAARSLGVFLDFDETLSDEEARIVARIPASEIGIDGEYVEDRADIERLLGVERTAELVARYRIVRNSTSA